VIELQLAIVAKEALTESQQSETRNAIVATASMVLDVEERYIACSMEETGRRRRLLAVSYDVTVAISIPETDPSVPKSVVMALSQEIGESTELTNLGVRAEIVSYAEEGEQQMSILPSDSSSNLVVGVVVGAVVGVGSIVGIAYMLQRRRGFHSTARPRATKDELSRTAKDNELSQIEMKTNPVYSNGAPPV